MQLYNSVKAFQKLSPSQKTAFWNVVQIVWIFFKEKLLPFSLQHCGLCLSICHIWRRLLICSMSVWSEKATWACQSWQIWRSTSTCAYFILPLSSHTFGIIINIIDDVGIYYGMWKPSRSSQVGPIENFINYVTCFQICWLVYVRFLHPWKSLNY